MKNILTFLTLFLFAFPLFAQVPQGMNYQAVARDGNGQPKANLQVQVQFSILKGANQVPEYSETNSAQTNAFGLFTLIIGHGNPTLGTFANINWADDVKFLKVEIDNQIIGISQLMSVPFAKYAQRTPLVAGIGIAVNDNIIINTGDLSNSNELQELAINGNSLSITNGNTVNLPAGPSYSSGAGINIDNNNVITALDISPSNELQVLTLTGNQLSLSNGGGNVVLPAEVDGSVTNEIQSLNLNGNELSLSLGGGSVMIPAQNTYDAGTGLSLNGNTFINTGDLDETNELQDLTISGNTLSITGGNSVTLPQGGSSQWTTVGNDIYYDSGKVLIGAKTPIDPYPGTVLQIASDSYEAQMHLYGVNGGSNYNNITMRELTTNSGWTLTHKANEGIDHQLMFEYLDGGTNAYNYNTMKLTPTGAGQTHEYGGVI